MFSFQSDNDRIEAVKKYFIDQPLSCWVKEARKYSEELETIITGDDFCEYAIKLEGITTEQANRKDLRKKFARDIRFVYKDLFKATDDIFTASGANENLIKINEKDHLKLNAILSKFKGNKSIEKYLQDTFFRLGSLDPNGLYFLEIDPLTKIPYPTYKSIENIRFYQSNGILLDYVIFEEEPINDSEKTKIRIVDSTRDTMILKDGNQLTIIEDESFSHSFGGCPAIVLSPIQEVGEETRLSYIDPVLPLFREYAKDKTNFILYKHLCGNPIRWQYDRKCGECDGLGKTGRGDHSKKCGACSGSGIVTSRNIDDTISITPPTDGQQKLAPELAGYIMPDASMLEQYKTILDDIRNQMHQTIWGMQFSDKKSDTATGRFIDVQPQINQYHICSSYVQDAHNEMANFVVNITFPTKKEKDEYWYYKSYGKRFILESPDAIFDKYTKAIEANAPIIVCDQLLNEFLNAKYKSESSILSSLIKRAETEPYVHYSIEVVSSLFGQKEALKKILYELWFNQLKPHEFDTMTKEEIFSKFDEFYKLNVVNYELQSIEKNANSQKG